MAASQLLSSEVTGPAKAGVHQLPRAKARIGATRSSTLLFFLVENVWLLQVQIDPVIFASMSIGNIITFSLGPFVLSTTHPP